jgi:hypothetical protein
MCQPGDFSDAVSVRLSRNGVKKPAVLASANMGQCGHGPCPSASEISVSLRVAVKPSAGGG